MNSQMPASCSVVVDSRMSAINGIYEQILSRLKENGYDKDDIFAIHLTFEEAFYNAVRHGNQMDEAKKVIVEFTIDAQKVEITVTDQGPGFNPDAVADPRYGENLFKPGGRGLLLMHAYMDIIKYNQQGNSVYMVRYKERPALDSGL